MEKKQRKVSELRLMRQDVRKQFKSLIAEVEKKAYEKGLRAALSLVSKKK